MKNKKIILTILLAAILAFISVLFIYGFHNKKATKPLPSIKPIETPSHTDVQDMKNDEKHIKLENTDNIETKNSKATIKPTKKYNPKEVKKPLTKVSDQPLKPITPKTETVQSAEVQKVEDNGIVVPVEYTSKNTYKYVYTPANFSK